MSTNIINSAATASEGLSRLNNNLRLLSSGKKRREAIKELYAVHISNEGFEFRQEDIPKEVVERVKAKIRREIKRKQIISTVMSMVLTILLLATLSLLAYKYLIN